MSDSLKAYLETKFEEQLAKVIADREVWSTVPLGHSDYRVQIAEARLLAGRYDMELDPSLKAVRWVLDCKNAPTPKLLLSQGMITALQDSEP